MNIIRKLPGPFLVFLGACSLSFGGLIVKSFEGATPLTLTSGARSLASDLVSMTKPDLAGP